MNHLEFVQSESYVSPSERRWETWLAEVEKVLGRSIALLSEDAELAHDCWLAGDTPQQCVTELWGAK